MNTLLIDIGNSRIKGRLVDARTGRNIDLQPTRCGRVADDWKTLAEAAVDVAFISNVADQETEASLVCWLRAVAPAVRIEHVVAEAGTADVINGYRHPGRLGSDRWMALVGAHAMFPDRSLLVCGFGTATTLDLLVRSGPGDTATFAGGLILPGVEAMHAALAARTARLDVRAGNVVAFADNTEDAITSGAMLAQRGALREAWNSARQRVSGRLDCVVSGGAGAPMTTVLDAAEVAVHHVPDLVLRGLAVFADSTAGRISGAHAVAVID